MKELLIEILKIIAPISVALIVFAQGLGIPPARVVAYFKERPGLLLRSLSVTLFLVPAVALVLILLIKPAHGVAIALAILVSCPPAPLMLKTTLQKGGSPGFMASLHLSMAALAFVTVPAILYLLSIPLKFHATVDLGKMLWILARTILLPLGLGLAFRALWSATADRLAPILAKAGMAGLAIVVLVALVALYPALLKMDVWSYLVMAAVSVAALAIGHWLAPGDPHQKTALAMESATRHPVLSLTIASSTFSQQQALPVMVPCVMTFIIVAMIYLAWRGRAMKLSPVP